MSKTTVLYHGGCMDGFTAAWVASKFLPPDTEFIPVYYGQEPPMDKIAGAHVYVLDFSYKRPVMERVIKAAGFLLLLDHHAGVVNGLAELTPQPNAYLIVKEGKSGARLTAEYFLRVITGMTKTVSDGMKFLIDYTEDRDLWRFELPDSKAINAWLRIQDMTFERWDQIAARRITYEIREQGRAILEYQTFIVKRYCDHARLVQFEGYEVPIVNCADPLLISEVGHELSELFPFSMTYFIRGDGKFQFSLRSDGKINVAKIARKHGGGGHKGAAGFELDLGQLQVLDLNLIFPQPKVVADPYLQTR